MTYIVQIEDVPDSMQAVEADCHKHAGEEFASQLRVRDKCVLLVASPSGVIWRYVVREVTRYILHREGGTT